MAKRIKVLIVEPGQQPRAEMIANTLEAMQAVVGGYIEVVRIGVSPLVIVCNEEGKLLGLPEDRPFANDVIRGTFFIVDTDGDEFASLDERLGLAFFHSLFGRPPRGMPE